MSKRFNFPRKITHNFTNGLCFVFAHELCKEINRRQQVNNISQGKALVCEVIEEIVPSIPLHAVVKYSTTTSSVYIDIVGVFTEDELVKYWQNYMKYNQKEYNNIIIVEESVYSQRLVNISRYDSQIMETVKQYVDIVLENLGL